MSDRIFCDTNVCLYALHAETPHKADRAMSILALNPTISTQVLGETARTMLMKFRYTPDETGRHLRFLSDRCNVEQLETGDFISSLAIFQRYSISWWDSLIVAVALRSNCSLLLTEDLQDGSRIDDRLTIMNPFK